MWVELTEDQLIHVWPLGISQPCSVNAVMREVRKSFYNKKL